jgi:hypothetical protein
LFVSQQRLGNICHHVYNALKKGREAVRFLTHPHMHIYVCNEKEINEQQLLYLFVFLLD